MSSALTLPTSMQPPAPPPNALDTTPGANPTESVVHYQLSSGQVASLPQSSVPALLKQDATAKPIPSPADGQVLVQLSSGHTATLPSTSLAALKQQDPSYKYIAGNGPTATKQTPDFSLKAMVAGPNTMVGAPDSPAIQEEGSGVSDILHGNFSQGAGRIWDAERPRVIQGSLLEKAIQKLDPTFQGSATPSEVANSVNRGNEPAVDVAQFIDKDQHPGAKAFAEAAQSFTSPATVATLIGSGGLGLVESPAALGLSSRLLSAGFSAAAIGSAYKNLKGFQEAFDAGDSSEAIYRLTHAVLSGTLAAFAGAGAVRETPVVRFNPFRASADALKAARATAGDAVAPTADVADETFSTRPLFRTGPNEEAGTSAVRTIADRATESAGGTPSGTPGSLRDVFDEAVDSREAVAKTHYKALDDASGNQWTANDNALRNVRREIQMKGGLNEDTDIKLNATKQRLEWQQEQIIDKAVKNGMPADVAQQARANWTQKSRLEDLQDIFNKKSNVSGPRPEMATPGVKLPPETYNFKAIAKDLNAMDPDDLTTALGKDGARDLTTAVNLAAKQSWSAGKGAAAIRLVLQGIGLGHIGAAAHLID